jgi:hypothetical protein
VEKRRVAFRFGGDSQVRYVSQPPEAGDYVNYGDELWLVTGIVEDDLGVSIVCEQPSKRAPPRCVRPSRDRDW